MIKYSIVVPVYNAENTIERCVESIIANNMDNIEIILIDDCSKDSSLEKCNAIAEKYKQIVVIHHDTNKGVSYARNTGIYAAKGKYTLFVDSDDWIDSLYCNTFDRYISENPDSFLICGYVNHDEKYNGRTDIIGWNDIGEYKVSNIKTELEVIYRSNLLQQLWNKLFITEIIQNNKLKFDESISIGEDFRFILEYIRVSKINKVVLINKPLYHYMRDQEGSLMFRVGLESVEEPLKNLVSLYQVVGYSQNEIEEKIVIDRENQIELYAYLIMHNAGMSIKRKKKLIYNLGSKQGKYLYKKNKRIYIKEKIVKLLHK
nr:glycosyltransferase family 2 protein [uncultured Ruminococcus sp.]